MADSPKLGIVLDGGGARAAYQVGLLRFLGAELPNLEIPVITGVSAGAINAAHLASRHDDFGPSIDRLTELWLGLSVDDIFRTDTWGFLKSVLGWGLRFVSGGRAITRPTRGLVDTAPLRQFLSRALPLSENRLSAIEANLDRGTLEAVGITTTNYGTGHSNTWVEGRDVKLWTRPHRRAISCKLTIDHILASASLPLFFPATAIGAEWHGDGGIRMTAPLSPALHLGADRILSIATRYERTPSELARSARAEYPSPARVTGVLLNAIFLDMIEYDATNMDRVNRLLDHVPESERGALRQVEILTLRPSEDLGALASSFEARLPRTLRFLMRGWGTRETESLDSLSMLMFQHDYLSRLVELGEADARARADEILAFVGADASRTPAG